MKRIFSIALWVALLCMIMAGCGKPEAVPSADSTEMSTTGTVPPESGMESIMTEPAPSGSAAESSVTEPTLQNTSEDTMYIMIGEHTLKVEMANNSSAEALLALLKEKDITVDAHDYGSFEEVGPLGTELPTNDEQITTQPGDVILYQGDQITLYYDTNSWSFTRLGKVQGVSAEELKAILGDGDVTMVLSLNASA